MGKKPIRTGKYCLSTTRRRLSRLTAAAIASLCMVGAGTSSYAVDFNHGLANLGSAFTVPVIDNDGQLPGSVSFVAPGPTGNTVYFYSNGEIGLALRGLYGDANSFTTISHVDANAASFTSGTPRASRTHYFSGNGIPLPTNIDNYNNVAAANLYDGISAQFAVIGRQLIGTYEIEAGSTAASIKLGFDNVSDAVLNTKLDDVDITLNSGVVLQLHAARVSVGGGELQYVPFGLDGNDPVLDLTGITSPTENVTVTVKLTFGAFYQDYDVVADNAGGGVAVSTGFNTMASGGDASDADIIITRLNAAGDDVVSTTILAGEADDVGYGVAVGNPEAGEYANQIYVSGYTKSTQFPANGQRDGGAEACVVRLNNDGSAVSGGTLISASGRDVAHHLIFCDGGLAVVGATDGGLPDINPGQLDFTTTFPTVAPNQKVQTYYLAVLDAAATTVNKRLSFLGPELAIPIRAGCVNGVIDVGVESGAKTTAGCNYTSEMAGWTWLNSPCRAGVDAMQTKWGWHALCWKVARYPSHTINANCPAPPQGKVQPGDEATLNNREANNMSCGSCGVNDPLGIWELNKMDNKYTWSLDLRAIELALGAAYYQECCESPVYANWKPNFSTRAAFLIRRVHLEVKDGNGNPVSLMTLCGTEYKAAQHGDMFDIPCLQYYSGANASSKIQFCSFDVVAWEDNKPPASTYTQASWNFSTLKAKMSPDVPEYYIADPPEDQPQTAGNIKEMTHRLLRMVTGEADVDVVTYTDGVAEGTATASVAIRVAAFHAPGHAAALPTSADEPKNGLSVSSAFGLMSSRPNPASDQITVTYQVNNAAVIRLELYDAMGQKVGAVDAGYRHPRQYSVDYNTSNLAAGTYYLRLSSDGNVLTMPLVIVH